MFMTEIPIKQLTWILFMLRFQIIMFKLFAQDAQIIITFMKETVQFSNLYHNLILKVQRQPLHPRQLQIPVVLHKEILEACLQSQPVYLTNVLLEL